MRASLTTPQGKARCLRYRNGKRCGRLGRFLVSYTDHQGYHRFPACAECAAAVGGEVLEESRKGYRVHTDLFTGAREYKKIR